MTTSAGVLLYRLVTDAADRVGVEVLLVHPGGPYWAKKDDGAWSLPKGEVEGGVDVDDERALWRVARREMAEETGYELDDAAPRIDLGAVRQKGGKVVRCFAVEGDLDAAAIVSNTFELEWPPRSGRRMRFPEVDRAAWLDLDAARRKILAAQAPFIERLSDRLDA